MTIRTASAAVLILASCAAARAAEALAASTPTASAPAVAVSSAPAAVAPVAVSTPVAASLAPAPAEQKAKLKDLVVLLESVSDDEYAKNLAEGAAAKGARPATRAAALKSAYASLAALEYRDAAAADARARYADAHARALKADADAASIDAGGLAPASWQMDLLKFLGNAAINYAVYGGLVLIGRETGAQSKQARVAGLVAKLDGAPADQSADLHYKIGAAYEELAAAQAPDAEQTAAARKKARLRELADLLQSVNDDDYKAALSRDPAAAGKPELASRSAVLKSAYVTLAALEYRDAGARSSADLKRVRRDGAKDVVVDPSSLQESGWAQSLLDLAQLGLMGYEIYEETREGGRRHGHGERPGAPSRAEEGSQTPAPAAPPSPVVQLPPQAPPSYWQPAPAVPIGGVRACPESAGGAGSCYGRGMPGPRHPIISAGRSVGLYEKLVATDAPLAAEGLAADKVAELHAQRGALYEQLAAAMTEAPAKAPEPPAERPQPKPKPKPAPEPPKPAPAPKAEAPAPAAEDPSKEAKEMEDMEKGMQQDIQKRRPPTSP